MRFLITAIGSFSADCVINVLKKNNHYVVGCDIYNGDWLAVAKDCDAFYQAPYAILKKEYIHFLIETCHKENIEYIIPLTDLEIDVLNLHRKTFEEQKIMLCMQSEASLDIARNKHKLYEFFKENSIVHVPYSIDLINKSLNFPVPAIAKPVDGRSSEGIIYVYTKEELSRLEKLEGYILQEVIEGSIFTVDYVRDYNGNDFCIPRKELIRTKNGAGITVKMINDRVLSNTVSSIGNQLNIVGCVNMEFIFNKGKYYLIDINPRFSAGIAFSYCVGYDMITSHVNCFIGKDILPVIIYKEQIITKRYKEEVLL